MNTAEEFKKGKHSIGYLDSDFLPRLGHLPVNNRPVPTFQKLPRYMTDVEIESELKPGFCELGDVLAFLDNAPEECKDGYANLFYFPAFVVYVHWYGGGWGVCAYERDGGGWYAGNRVFSPATESSGPVPSGSLELRLSALEEWKRKVEKVIHV